MAERNIQTLEQRLATMVNDSSSISKKIREILFRNTATILHNGKTPLEMYIGRQIRTKLYTHKPSNLGKSSLLQGKVRNLSEGDRVRALYYSFHKLLWKLGVILKKLVFYITSSNWMMGSFLNVLQLRLTNIKI